MNDHGWTARLLARATRGHERLALHDRQHGVPLIPDRIHERYIEHTWAIQPPLKTPVADRFCHPPMKVVAKSSTCARGRPAIVVRMVLLFETDRAPPQARAQGRANDVGMRRERGGAI
eukprot:541799-Pyramimonas_sp.AAC.1